MNSRYVAMGLIAVVLAAVGWSAAQPPAPAPTPQGGDKMKPSRFQVVSAGFFTAVMIDHETGKTWGLYAPGMDFRGGPGGLMEGTEFAWVPITKFEDLDSYRRWSKQQVEHRMKMERERYKDRFDKDKAPKEREKEKDKG